MPAPVFVCYHNFAYNLPRSSLSNRVATSRHYPSISIISQLHCCLHYPHFQLIIGVMPAFPDKYDSESCSNLTERSSEKWGLDIVFDNYDQSARDTLAQVKLEALNNGILAGWKSLSEMLPQWGLHPQMVTDALTTIKIYQSVSVEDNVNRSSEIRMTVKSSPSPESLAEIGPKSMGGKAWESSASYMELQKTWNCLTATSLPPCPVWIWIGMIMKVVSKDHQRHVGTLHMMSTVDYDLDRNSSTKTGFAHTMDIAAECVASPEISLRGAALAALFSFDIQKFVRRTQEAWLLEPKGVHNLGADEISPRDWVSGAVGDCAGLSPFGYLSSLDYARGKASMFLAMALANSHDILYDICSQNRMSSVIYAAAAGGAMQDKHTVFLHTVMDEVARRVSRMCVGEPPLYGDSAAMCTAAWVPFNGRYRTWERFVKYHRLLQAARDSSCRAVLEQSVCQTVFRDYNLETDDVVPLWEAAIDTRIERPMGSRKRELEIYPIALASDGMFDLACLSRPDLCSHCNEAFSAHAARSHPEIHAAVALDTTVLESPAIVWAATIAFFARWATEETCCNCCAVKVGIWADGISYIVLVELMQREAASNHQEWLLSQYAAWCAAAAPVSVATILSGFDLRADISAEAGAMGDRDTVDC